MLNPVQLQQYLDRLEYSAPLSPDYETLCALQWAHLSHITYENVSILMDIPLSLDPQDLFQKIIVEKKGGFCFELQGLYKELLEGIGFSVKQYAGRFMDVPDLLQMRRHRILLVELDGVRYLADVGVRQESPRKPLKLVPHEVQYDGVCEYKLEQDTFFGWVLCQKEKGKDWKTIYGFTEEPQVDIDYVMPCFFCEKHPESTFNKFLKVSLFDGESNFTIVDGVLKEYRDAKVQWRKILANEEETKEALIRYFHLESYFSK